MSEPEPHPASRETSVAACAHGLAAARTRMRVARQQATQGTNTHRLRADLLDALEAYATAIMDAGAPVPYRIRDEINLYRRLVRRV